tara:strand:- start:285 stop:629 length:345 start_codon:yes stop_codon:yes gene_type:complete
MGEYVYKVTGKKITLSNGIRANIAVYAYKPYGGSIFDSYGETINNQLHWESGCYNAERYVRTSKGFTGNVILGHREKDGRITGSINSIPIKYNRGTLTDYDYDYRREKQERGMK